MRKVFVIILIMALPYCAWASIIKVCSSCEYSTLAQAYSDAQPYDTLMLAPGVYESVNLEITIPLTIIGEKGAVLDGQDKGYIIKILSDNVHISGLILRNAGRSYTKDFAAIYTSRINNFSIKNNVIENPYFGVLLEKSHNGEISGNIISGNKTVEADTGNGVHAWHCSNLLIDQNEMYGLRDGIYLEFVADSKIYNNYSHNNIRYGLHFMFSNNDEYVENTFEDNGAGVAVMFSKFILMKNNKFLQNWGTASYGLLLKEIYDGEVVNNTFKENTIGIFIEGSTRINYTSNDFERNGWAIKVSGGCYLNIFSKNNFLSNSFDLSYNTKMNDNSFDGNYWSSYSGYDLDKDKIGDVPFRPVKLFSYVVNRTPETIILLRSLFVDIINFSERVSPIFTPNDLLDNYPAMKRFKND
ncbi:nitrous oxide reductase family maturation protein NosD [Roseivirga echinicomitans]